MEVRISWSLLEELSRKAGHLGLNGYLENLGFNLHAPFSSEQDYQKEERIFKQLDKFILVNKNKPQEDKSVQKAVISKEKNKEGGLVLVLSTDFVDMNYPHIVQDLLEKEGINTTKPYDTFKKPMEFKVTYVQKEEFLNSKTESQDVTVESLMKLTKDKLISKADELGLTEDNCLDSLNKNELSELIILTLANKGSESLEDTEDTE